MQMGKRDLAMSVLKNLNGKTLVLTKIEDPNNEEQDQVDEAYASSYTDMLIRQIIAFETAKEMNMWARKATSFDDLEVSIKTNKVFRYI